MKLKVTCPEGSPHSKLAFVGEAYGELEEYYGKPFIGPAGQKLWDICRPLNISRGDCYLNNVVKERPLKNNIGLFITFDKGGSAIETPDFKRYKEQLLEELACTTGIIMPLGNVAMYAITGYTGILRRRGSVYTVKIGDKDRTIIPSIHPSAALRQQGTWDKKKGGSFLYTHYIRADLRKALRFASGHTAMPLNLLVYPDFTDITSYLRYIFQNKLPIGLDIEVVNEEISCLAISILEPSGATSMSIPFYGNGRDYFPPDQEAEIWSAIGEVMQDPLIEKVGQNFIFDCGFIFRKYGIRPVNVNCTMVAMAVLYPELPRGLDFINSIYTDNIPYYKDEGKKYMRIGGDERTFYEYNAKDAVVCSIAWPTLRMELAKQGNTATYIRQNRMLEPCLYMQERGMLADIPGLKAASERAQREVDILQEELNQLAGTEINMKSPKQLIEYFYFKKRIKPYTNNDGNMTTDEDAMRRLARKGIREAQIIRDSRRWLKLKGTYYDAKLSPDGRIRSAMSNGKTRTGRLASSKDVFDEGMNIQNLPEVFRQYVLTDEGFITYVCDLSQVENRIVANIAPEPTMLQIFEMGKDFHSITGAYVATLITGKRYTMEQVAEEDDKQIKAPIGTGEYTWRFWGKKSNHSFDYDFGGRKFALKFDLEDKVGMQIRAGWDSLYVGIRQMYAWVQEKLRIDHSLTNLMGRKRIFLGELNDKTFKEAYAQIPQSTVADKINEQGVEFLYYNEDKLFLPVDLKQQVHDSVVFQLPLSLPWEDHARILLTFKQSMETPLEWHGRKFATPLDITMHIHNLSKADGRKIKIYGTDIGRLAQQLSEIYSEHRGKRNLPALDRDIDDSSLLEEEMSDALGDADSIS